MKKITTKAIVLEGEEHFSLIPHSINMVNFNASVSDVDTSFSFFNSKRQSINLGCVSNALHLHLENNDNINTICIFENLIYIGKGENNE